MFQGWNSREQASMTKMISNNHIWGGGWLQSGLRWELQEWGQRIRMLDEVCQLNAYGINRGMSWSGQNIKSTDLTVSVIQSLDFWHMHVLVLFPVRASETSEMKNGWGLRGTKYFVIFVGLFNDSRCHHGCPGWSWHPPILCGVSHTT